MKIVLQDWKYGRIMRYTNDMYIGDSIGLYGEYSHDEMELYKQLLRTGDVVIEVGANIGALTVPIAQHIGNNGRVYAFEPQRITYQILCGNVVLNNVYNVWTYNQGVGKEHKKTKIYEGLFAGNNGSFQISKSPGNYEIEIVTLDEYNFEKCDLLKIDAEGMDVEVIQGAINLIKRCQPFILMEANYTKEGKEIIKKLQKLEYKIYEADNSLYSIDNDFQTSTNVFLKAGTGTGKYNYKITDDKQSLILQTFSFNWLCVPNNKNIKVVGDVVDINKWKD